MTKDVLVKISGLQFAEDQDNGPVAKTDITAADLHRQDRLGAGESCKHLGKQGGKLLLGKGLHEIVERTDLKALQRVVG